jgi:glycosyltransferase involved in cell wall biosynthesis
LSPTLPSIFSIPYVSYLITEELVRRGHDITIFAPSDSKTSAKIAEGWVPSTHFWFKKYPLGSKERNKIFKRYCFNLVKQSGKFDIIHNHCMGLFFFDFIKMVNTPIIHTLHDPFIPVLDKEILKKLFFVAISKKQVENNKKVNFVGIVHHGIRIEKFPFNDKPKDYLFWFGRIDKIKGPEEAIEVARLAKKKLVFAGNYFEKDEYVKKIMKKIRENKSIVKSVGKLSFKKKIEYLKNASAFIFPLQWEEPFGLVMVEAMACGTPVIAFNHGAVPEIVKNGKTGFVVNSVFQMAKAIKKIPEISRKECREWVEEKFSVEKMVDGYEKIYKKIIKDWKKSKPLKSPLGL